MSFFDTLKMRFGSRTIIIAALSVVALVVFGYSIFGRSSGSSAGFGTTTSVDGVKTEKPVISMIGEKGAVNIACVFGQGTSPKNPKCSFTVKNSVSGTVIKTKKVDDLTAGFYISSSKSQTGQFSITANISANGKKVTKETIINFNLKQEVSNVTVGVSKIDLMYQDKQITDGMIVNFNSSETVSIDLNIIAYDMKGAVSKDKLVYTWLVNPLDSNTIVKTTPKDKNETAATISITPKNRDSRKGNIRVNIKVDNKGKQKNFITDFVVTFADFDTNLIYNFTNSNIAYFSSLKNSRNLGSEIEPILGRIAAEITKNTSIEKVYNAEYAEVKRMASPSLAKELLDDEKKMIDMAVVLQEKKKVKALSNTEIGDFFNFWITTYAKLEYMNR